MLTVGRRSVFVCTAVRQTGRAIGVLSFCFLGDFVCLDGGTYCRAYHRGKQLNCERASFSLFFSPHTTTDLFLLLLLPPLDARPQSLEEAAASGHSGASGTMRPHGQLGWQHAQLTYTSTLTLGWSFLISSIYPSSLFGWLYKVFAQLRKRAFFSFFSSSKFVTLNFFVSSWTKKTEKQDEKTDSLARVATTAAAQTTKPSKLVKSWEGGVTWSCSSSNFSLLKE